MATKYIVNNVTGQTITGDITIHGNLTVTGTSNITTPYRTFTANVYKGIRDMVYNTTLTYDNFYSLKKGETYYITSFSVGDDFSNLSEVISGDMNNDYCIFEVTGDSRYYKNLDSHISPNVWENGTTLFGKGKLINEVIYNDFGYDLEWSYNYDHWWGYYGMTLSFPEDIDPSKLEVQLRANNSNATGVEMLYFSTNGFRLECSSIDWNWGEFFDGTNDEIYAIEIQSDDKVLVGGAFNGFYELPTLLSNNYHIFRINSDGTKDDTFMVDNVGAGFVGFNDYVYTIKMQDDGKILVGGSFSDIVDGAYDNGGIYDYNINYIVRLNTDGTRDSSFLVDENDGFNDAVYSIDVDADGKILVTGAFTQYTYSSTTYDINRIIKLNSDGSPDETFLNAVGSGQGFTNYYGESVVVCLDSGKYLVCGAFDEYVDSATTYTITGLVRLNNDGTLDNSFIYNGFTPVYHGTAYLNAMKVQEDGKIVVGGDFIGYEDGTSYIEARYLIRLTSDGYFDTTFKYDAGNLEGINSTVWALDITPEGKIIAGGEFDQFGITGNTGLNYYNFGYMVVLDEYGLPIVDENTGVNDYIYAVKYCGNKKFYAGGYFYADYNYNIYPFWNGQNFWRFNLENDIKVTLDFDNYDYESQSWNVHAEVKVYN